MTILRNYIASLFCLVALTMYSVSAMAGAQGYQASSFGQCGTVTGGGNATPTLVSTASALTNALSASGSAVIIITQNIEMPYTSVKVTNKTILALPGVKLYSNEQTASTSGILYFKSGSNNVIMRNLTFEGPGAYDCDGRDNLCFDGATNIWVDHCDFQDGCDGNFDNKGNTDNITISWCRFHYLKAPKAGGSGGSNDHRFTNLIGSSSSAKPSDGAYTMTWAYCWWDEGCRERMPRVRNADLHMLNCVWTSSVANYYVGPENARVRFDGCYFGSLAASKIFKSYGGTNAAKYNNCYSAAGASLSDTNASSVANFSYAYDVLSPSVAYSNVTNSTYGAGATLNVTTSGTITEGDGSGGGSTPTPSDTKTVSVSSTTGGAASASATSVTSGTSVTFTATPSAGYEFVNWTNTSGSQVSTANPYVATITDDTSLRANFVSNTACDITSSTINGSTATISGNTIKATIPYTAGTTIPVVLTLSTDATCDAGTSFTMTLAADAGATVGRTVTVTAKNGTTTQSYTITLTRAADATLLEVNGSSVSAGGTFTGSTCTTNIKFAGSTEVSDGSDKSPLSITSGTVYRSSDATSITLGFVSTSASQIVIGACSSGSSERTVTGVSVNGVALDESAYTVEGTIENKSTVYRVTISGLEVAQGSTVTIDFSGNSHLYYFEVTPVPEQTAATKSDDATLSDLKVSGTTVTGFSAATTTYNVELASGTTVVPTVTATANDTKAQGVVINAASALPGSTTVVVTAEDGSSKTYTINFTVASSGGGDSQTLYSWNGNGSTTTANETGGTAVVTGDKNEVGKSQKGNYTLKFASSTEGQYITITLTNALSGGETLTLGNFISTTDTNKSGQLKISYQNASDTEVGSQNGTLISTASGTDVTNNLNSNGTPVDEVLTVPALSEAATKIVLTRQSGLTGATALYVSKFVITTDGGSTPTPTPKSNVCTLSDLKSGGTTVAGFAAATTSYDIELAEGTTSVPVVVATCTDSKATAAVSYGTISGNAATTTVTVTAEDGTQKTYTINYTVAQPVVTTYTVAASAGNGGSATVSPSGTVVSGASVTFTATPASGYTFTNWTDGGTPVSTDASYTTTVTGNLYLTANFTKQSDTSGRNWTIDGFAAYEGTSGAHYHAGGTTGGQGGEVVYASNFTQLQGYLQSNNPYIILIDHDITTGVTAYVDALSTGHLCDAQDGSEGVATTYGERIMVQSNKTLIGIADANGNAPLISRITFNLQCAHNVIIRNCRFTMNSVPILKSGENKIVAMRDGVQTEVGDPDCIGIQADAISASTDSGSHIWIDHCEFFNGNATNVDRYDGLVDIKNNVQWVTISYNYFHDHYKACLFGKGDSDNYDRTVTMHHNVFENIVGSRLPLQRYGHLHYVNNYMENASDGYDLRAGAIGYIESCYFKDSKAPVRLRGEGTTNIRTDSKEYSIVYDNCRRVINNSTYFTYLNAPSKYDEEYTWAGGTGTNSNTWVPTQTWSSYVVHNIDPVLNVPDVCEQYSGAGKVVLWDSYTTTIPAEDITEFNNAVANSSYTTYNADGTKYVPNAVEADEYDVKFYSQGTQVGSTQSIESGSYATAPTDPSRDGYTFEGWSVNGTNVVNVATYAIISATNFQAVWTQNTADADDLELIDGAEYTGTEEKTYADGVTYTRTFGSILVNKWTSFYVPFAVDIEANASMFDIAEIFALCPLKDTNNDGVISSDDDDYLILMKKTTGNTVPNRPYLIRPKAAGECAISAVDGKIYAAANGTVSCYTVAKAYTFIGTYSTVVANVENGYRYMSGGVLDWKTPSSTYPTTNINTYRWYMVQTDKIGYGSSTQSQNSVKIAVIDEETSKTTAIEAIKQSKDVQTGEALYNLAGQRVSNTGKSGLYIKNGRKYVIK